MLKLRIIPCLDVLNGKVVKGTRFKNHDIVGDILPLAEYYCATGADELVFYDISASPDSRLVDKQWIQSIAQRINIPFCVAGGIQSMQDAELIFESGADKVSINSHAIANPDLINQLSDRFGKQSIVVGIDSMEQEGNYGVYQYTGSATNCQHSQKNTLDWAKEVAERGAGEIVLNCMNRDGVRQGYDLKQTALIASSVNIPVIASGGAGAIEHFTDLFSTTQASGALAASVFHRRIIDINALKTCLANDGLQVRLC